MEKQSNYSGVLGLLLLIAGVVVLPGYCWANQIETSFNRPMPLRYPAHDFVLSDLNGNQVQLSDYRGTVVVLMFWTTW